MQNKTGIVSKDESGFRVMFERTFSYPIETVWDAITNPAKLKIWFTDFEMDFVPGGKIVIRFQDKARTESFGKIIQIDPPKLFQYSWEEELATWELVSLGKSQCKLILTYSKLSDTYAVSVPAGWHVLLDQLETVLQGRTQPYPFGAEEETPEAGTMKKMYAEIILKQYPELKSKTENN